MAMYLIGDVQGCDAALGRLLDEIGFSPSRDTVYLLGDLVNRGPGSAEVLRRVMGYGPAARCLLGNHDLHLLAVAYGARPPSRKDTLQPVLEAADRTALLDWLREQPLARFEHGRLMVHAGVLPQWTTALTLALAAEVADALRGDEPGAFLREMYGNAPVRWSDDLRGADRLRVAVNGLTRLRFCTPDGSMEFGCTDGPAHAPPGHVAWFDAPHRKTAGTPIAFGHWSALGFMERPDLVGLDSGCVWGGALSALEVGATPGDQVLFQTRCRPTLPAGG